MTRGTRLELTWPGKHDQPRLEPRILLEDPSKSYCAQGRVTDADRFDNLLIHGDNLLALKALEHDYAGKVKCVYIDPPYNTGSAFTHYDDGMEHSLWLSMMQHRLAVICHLLREDGSVWISIDDQELHYLKILCDEVFGRFNFVASIIWEKRTSRENRRAFSFNHDYVLVYAREKVKFEAVRNPIGLTDEVRGRYKNPDGDPRGPWQSVSANAQAGHATASQFYELTLPSGRTVQPPKGRCWLYSKERMQAEIAKNNIWFGENGDNVPRVKKFLSESSDSGLTPETIWTATEVGTNDDAKKNLNSLLSSESVFDSPKPEQLLERILHIATNPGDLVLDSFAGSGTTGAVAHKMGRRWIMVELGDHCHTHVAPRLRKVIDGTDPGGVTDLTGWKGGGGFRYYNLAPSLLEKDGRGQWIISKQYNAAMLAEAICKHEGFEYAPSQEIYWQHGHRRDSPSTYVWVTTQTLTRERLARLSAEVGSGCQLMVLCLAFKGDPTAFENLVVKKLPTSILDRCEWGRDDYSLKIASLGAAPTEATTAAEATAEAGESKARARKAKASAVVGQGELFGAAKKGEDQ